MNDDKLLTGGCLCGRVRYEIRGEPIWVVHCHCASCRRHTGSPMTTFVGLEEDQLSFSAGEPGRYQSSPGVWRGFCAECGTPLTYSGVRAPGEMHVYLGTLDEPEAVRPTRHVFTGEALSWFQIADELPRHQTTSRGAAKPGE